MRTNTPNINIMRDVFKRKNFLKSELKILILKSITSSKQTNPKIRLSAYFNIIFKFRRRNRISTITKPCLLTGKPKTTTKLFHFGRHATKELLTLGLIQNTRINIK